MFSEIKVRNSIRKSFFWFFLACLIFGQLPLAVWLRPDEIAQLPFANRLILESFVKYGFVLIWLACLVWFVRGAVLRAPILETRTTHIRVRRWLGYQNIPWSLLSDLEVKTFSRNGKERRELWITHWQEGRRKIVRLRDFALELNPAEILMDLQNLPQVEALSLDGSSSYSTADRRQKVQTALPRSPVVPRRKALRLVARDGKSLP